MKANKPNKKHTGTIYDRDYGIKTLTRGEPLFSSPTRYAMGIAQLIDPNQITEMLITYSMNQNLPLNEVVQLWDKGLKRFRSNTFETVFGKEAITDVHRYGRIGTRSANFKAKVVSKGGKHKYQVNFSPDGTKYSCACPDYLSSPEKGMQVMCRHIATLAVAIAADRRGRVGSENNLTGLTEKNFRDTMPLPFRIGHDLLADLVVGYVARRIPFDELNIAALGQPQIYSPALKAQIRSGEVQFAVLRQEEQKKDHDIIPESEKRHYGAVRPLIDRLFDTFKDNGVRYDGYSRVFQGSEFEAVARRHRSANVVYETVALSGELPFIVRKTLGRFSENWLDHNDRDKTHPLQRGDYTGIDDATRREAVIEILRPGTDFPTFIPQLLARKYDRVP